jgi:hypothetical protein
MASLAGTLCWRAVRFISEIVAPFSATCQQCDNSTTSLGSYHSDEDRRESIDGKNNEGTRWSFPPRDRPTKVCLWSQSDPKATQEMG